MQRLHPLSAILDAISRGVQTAVTFLILGIVIGAASGAGDVGLGGAFAFVGFFVGSAYAIAYYFRFEYGFSGDTFVVTSGVFARQEREIPLRRIQNVDISRPPLQRLLGLAVVRFETAGGSTTEAVLDAVSREEARRLQRDIGEFDPETEATIDEGRSRDATTSAAPDRTTEERTLFELSPKELAALCVVSFRPGAAVVAVFALSVGDDLVFLTLQGFLGPDIGTIDDVAALQIQQIVLAVAVALVLFVLVSWLVSAALMLAGYYGFRLTQVGDELRYERGLVGRYSGSIPLDKIQTLSVQENLFMRAIGYASLTVETAGYAPGSDEAGGGQGRTIPLARRERVIALAGQIEAFDDLSVERPPRRARRRYAGRYTIGLGVLAGVVFGIDYAFFGVDWAIPPAVLPLVLLPLVPFAAHLKWRNLGYRLDPDVLVTRSGFWRRSNRIVPYYRIQTVFERQTIFQRRWRLASVVADTAGSFSVLGGDPIAHDRDREEARRLHEQLRDRLHEQLQTRREARARRLERSVRAADVRGRDDEGQIPRRGPRGPRNPGQVWQRELPDGRASDGDLSRSGVDTPPERTAASEGTPGDREPDREPDRERSVSTSRSSGLDRFLPGIDSGGTSDLRRAGPNEVFCPECTAIIADDLIECPECGATIGGPSSTPDSGVDSASTLDPGVDSEPTSDAGTVPGHPISERGYLAIGGVSGVLGLFVLPIVFGPLAALAGYQVYRLYDQRRGRMLIAWGIFCTIVGTALGILVFVLATG